MTEPSGEKKPHSWADYEGRKAVEGTVPSQWWLDLRIERDRLLAEREDAIAVIGEYSEGLAPNDLLGAVQWAESEDARLRRRLAELESDPREGYCYVCGDHVESFEGWHRTDSDGTQRHWCPNHQPIWSRP